jgi:PAS domain S-box-containing protein
MDEDRNGPQADNSDQRVLVLALTAKDAELTRTILQQAGVECLACTSLQHLCDELAAGTGAALIAEEAVGERRDNCLIDWLARQPSWSDLPVLIFARPGADSAAVAQALELLGNVTVLERPMRVASLVSAVHTALRARQRQYQTRDHLTQIEQFARDQSRLAAIVESSDDAIISKTLDGHILTWNAGAQRLFGYTADEVIGRPITILIPPDRQHEEPAVLAKLRRGERIEHFETIRLTKDGRLLDISLSVSPVRDAGGKVIGASNVSRDITEQKRAEAALRSSEQHLELLSNSVPALISYVGPDRCYRTCNQAYTTWFGLPHDEVVGRPMREVLGEEAWKVIGPRVDAAFSGMIVEYEAEAHYERGGTRWIHAAYTPHLDSHGQVLGVIVLVIDVTERKRAEQQLRRSEAEARTLLELHRTTVANLGEGMYTVDRQGLVTYVNPEAERLFGWTAAELLGKRMHEVTHHHYPDGRPFPIEECSGFSVLHEGQVLRDFEDTFIRKDGTFFPVAYSSSPLKGADGQTVGLVVVFQDITERKLHEQALRDADRRKDEFLAMLAHELRNPLAPIRNSLNILRLMSQSDPAVEQVGQMMERQVNHMVRLVDDLLEVSRITRGKIELRLELVEVAGVVRSAVETSQPLISAAGHQLAVSIPPEPLTVHADPVRLSQVISNLLNNSAKYTETGGQIWLTVRREDDHVAISVRDTGIGIAPEMLPNVFQLFTQVDRDSARAQGGLGIGLTLVKSLTEMHGGEVHAHSAGPGQGSEFVIRLPLAAQQAGAETPPAEDGPRSGFSPRRILVVDDNRDAAMSMGMLLKVLGSDVRVEFSGPDALSAMAEYRPAIVLLDIGMPGMDGYEVARRIRQQPEYKDVTLIALTGWGQESDRRRSQSAGFDYHLTKPADINVLETLLISLQTDR